VVHGRADRIDILTRGGASIIDYKTGSPPSDKQVKELLAPQLPIEAAILHAGGFATVGTMKPEELVYVRFSGGVEAGSWRPVKVAAVESAANALALLTKYVVAFDDPRKGYISRAIPFRSDLAGTFDHLARHGEWTAAVIEDVDE
jgi:ATP-dependent helicase/nuclease subunit B